jgi:AcrR family transcriptional regulator
MRQRRSSAFLKRVPIQSRGGRSVERILQACEEMLGEMPFDEVSIEDIARRAGVPVGSIYFFFSNRLCIFFRLIEVALDQIADVYEFPDSSLHEPLNALLRQLEDRLAVIWTRHHDMLDLYFSYRVHPQIQPIVTELRAYVDQQMASRLAATHPWLSPARRRAVARLINVNLMQGLDIAADLPAARARAFRAEWSSMLHRYIEGLAA